MRRLLQNVSAQYFYNLVIIHRRIYSGSYILQFQQYIRHYLSYKQLLVSK